MQTMDILKEFLEGTTTIHGLYYIHLHLQIIVGWMVVTN